MTAIEDEYREAVEKHGREAAFKELSRLYHDERHERLTNPGEWFEEDQT